MHDQLFDEAITLYLDMLTGESGTAVTDLATKQYILAQIAESHRAAGKTDLDRFLNTAVRPTLGHSPLLHATTLELESIFFVQHGRYNEALAIMQRRHKEYASVEGVQERALFGLAYVNGILRDNVKEGRKYARQLNAEHQGGVLAEQARRLMQSRGSEAIQELHGTSELANGNQLLTPERFGLLGNYPNPFSTKTTLQLSLPVETDVRVSVYDIMGREVMRPIDGFREAGFHKVSIDASHLSPRLYLYRLDTPGFSESGRMVLVR